MTADELREAQDRAEQAYARAVVEGSARNDAIRVAISEGWTHAQIAEATGLTRGRIGQLAQT